MVFILRKKTLARGAAALCAAALAVCAVMRSDAVQVFLRAAVESPPVFVIDAGHGGEDGGAVAEDGTAESGINLAVALRLEALLDFLGCETRLTRADDAAIYASDAKTLREKKRSDLENRVRIVNETPRAVLVSIHQNSLPSARRVHGAQAFFAADEESRALAERVQTALNRAVNAENEKSARQIDSTVYLMRMAECPAVLVECGFLSNAQEAARLREEDYQQRLAVTIAAGCLSYTSEAGEQR